MNTLTFPTESRPSKSHTTSRTCRSQQVCINHISPPDRFQRLLRSKAPAIQLEIGTFWSTWSLVEETILPFTKCGKEYTRTVRGAILRTRFGPTSLRIT